MLNQPKSDREIIAEMLTSTKHELAFFSNEGKQDRERWVVSQLLLRLGIEFIDSELISPPLNSRVDVLFRDAKFQVKEITDPECRRYAEIKERYGRLRLAQGLGDVGGSGSIYDVPCSTSIYSLVLEQAVHLDAMQKYIQKKQETDLLFYITRSRASPILNSEIDRDRLDSIGWRSISCIAGATSVAVLQSSRHAPSFPTSSICSNDLF